MLCISTSVGIKGWGLSCPSGFTFVQSVDGGFLPDPVLRAYGACPMGRTTRTVLHVILKTCPALAKQIDGSGVKIGMDNYFTSPCLLLCLASHDIFAVGTVRKNRMGVDGALQFMAKQGMIVKKRGDMAFARSGNLVVVHWMDAADLTFCSTIHIFEEHFQPKEYE